jgi:hypothetical protein
MVRRQYKESEGVWGGGSGLSGEGIQQTDDGSSSNIGAARAILFIYDAKDGSELTIFAITNENTQGGRPPKPTLKVT